VIAYGELSSILLSLIISGGLLFLFLGGESLCKGAESLAIHLNINPLVIGLTIVAIATSLPELVTSMYAAVANSPDIAIGNIVGSNLVNITLILGVAAIISPIKIHLRIIKKEMPILMGVSLLFFIFCFSETIPRWQGFILLILFLGYMVFVIRAAKVESSALKKTFEVNVKTEKRSLLISWVYIIGGAVLLHFGAEFLVKSSIEIAYRLGISETLIGLTIVAIGTSLPELAASIAAARRGQSDICAGNIIGSNLFNMMLIGGSVSSIFTLKVDPELLKIELPAMIVFTAIIWYFFTSEKKVTRLEGFTLVVLYVILIAFSGITKLNL